MCDASTSKGSDCSVTPVTAVATPIVTALEGTGISVVTVNNRKQAISQKPAVRRPIKSPPHPDASFATVVQKKNQRQLSGKSSEKVKVVPSRIVNPHVVSSDVPSPTGANVSGTTSQSGTVQVIDLTRHVSSDTQVARNGISAATHHTTRSSQIPHQVAVDSLGKLSAHSETSKEHATSVLTRNGSSTPTKGNLEKVIFILIAFFTYVLVGAPVSNPVILLPTAPGNVGSAMMMQPQPYILVNPTAELSRVNHPTLIGSPNIYCGAGSGYILVSPNTALPNSLLQVVSSAGVCVPRSGLYTSSCSCQDQPTRFDQVSN